MTSKRAAASTRDRRRTKRPSGAPSGAGDLPGLFEPYVWAWFEGTFGKPSPPQVAAWPRIAEGRNTLIFSPTGSGKTLAAFLWCINELFKMGREQALKDSVYVLYVSPLKALNNDIQKNLVEPLGGITKHARRARIDVPEVRSEVRTGDTSPQKRAEMARRPPQIFITTPESLFIILSTPKFRRAFRTVKYVIVDEIHAMSDNKRGVHLSLSLERLQHLADGELVRIGCSATQKPLDEIARFLVGADGDGRPRDCEIVDIGARKNLNVHVLSPVDNLLEAHFDAVWGSAYDRMISLIRGHDTTLVFTNSRYKTERTALRLNELSAGTGVAVGAHHGSMSKGVRLDMENALKAGRLDALVATSSLELGIDVGSINLVCQIESPKSVSRGMQRIGRAGHLLDATSEGRLLVTDRDDLVESAVLVAAIMDSQVDTTRIPRNCLDVLAQHVVGAVAADDWGADDLFACVRRSYCYRDLDRADFDRVLDMLAGNYRFEMDQAPYAKIFWDKVNNVLSPQRSARMIAFRSSGTIPDVADYDVYFEQRRTKVGQLDEGFVEDLRAGDIFILGSSSWRVLGIRRNRVIVEDVYGLAPTIPHWQGDRSSRTNDLGVLVGRFRREMGQRLAARRGESPAETAKPIEWLRSHYYVDENGARSICEYFREQQLVTGEIPSDRLVMVEHFEDELGHQQIVIHSSFGIRVNDTWAMALCRAIEAACGFRPQEATVDDGLLITVPKGRKLRPERICKLVTPQNVDELIDAGLAQSPVFASRFRHNAVRALLVLREYQGRKTPVWLQALRASALLEACRQDDKFPVITETLRECRHEALDVANLRHVLRGMESGRIRVKTIKTRIPSPFTHSLLLLGQYGEMGSIPARERRSRLIHLHRELLKQILDEETLGDLLDEEAAGNVEARLQRTHPQRRARSADELARVLVDLGDLVDGQDEEMSLLDRVEGDLHPMLDDLVAAHRAVLVPISTAEMNRERWISTENLPLYRAAFATPAKLEAADRKILRALEKTGPCPLAKLGRPRQIEQRLERLVHAYEVLRVTRDQKAEYVATGAWLPKKILNRKISRGEARAALVRKFLRWHGPTTSYEIMERYGFPGRLVEEALAALHEQGSIARGEYVPTKSFPQWCHRPNLEEIHRLTLSRLRKEMEPASPEEYADFLIRWQHVHPDTRLAGVGGLREAIAQLQGHENYQALFERDLFPSRVRDYDPSMLDRLCYGGEVVWRRFSCKGLKRGQIGFCFAGDRDWIVADPNDVKMDLGKQDEDIAAVIDAVRAFLARKRKTACFFDDIVKATRQDRRLVLRAIWRLVWNGEATIDSYESIRHARITSGLSACYDLSTELGRGPIDQDAVVRHMLENRRLDPTLGRWAPTERLKPAGPAPPDADRKGPPAAMHRGEDPKAMAWAHLLLKRHGIVCRDSLQREVTAPPWRNVRRALARLELLGKVRRGFFVQELSGEQYAYPQAVDALREAKLRHPRANGNGEDGRPAAAAYAHEPMILLNSCEPANPFVGLFGTMNQASEKVRFPRNPHNSMVVQYGQPLLLHHQGRITLLADLTRDRAERAVKALLQLVDDPRKVGSYAEIHVRDWNGHPADVSPARHLLVKLGFAPAASREKGFVYDGTHGNGRAGGTRRLPDRPRRLRRVAPALPAEAAMPEVFERAGKEEAPVEYDAEWIVARSPRKVQAKVRELLDQLAGVLPAEFELAFHPRHFAVRYRGVGCAQSDIGHKKIRLRWFHQGFGAWLEGTAIDPQTDVRAAKFVAEIRRRLAKSREGIDARLSRYGGPS